MTFDDRLRKLTDDIGRGTTYPANGTYCRDCRCAHNVWAAAHPTVPLASDAMAERDDHGEVKGVMF